MTHSPLPHTAANKPVASKPEPRVPPDFKARFGVVPEGPQPKMTRLQARRAKRKRMRTGMVAFALLLGTVGATAFLVAQDFRWAAETFKSVIATVMPPAKAPETAPAPVVAAAPLAPAPAPVSQPASTFAEAAPPLAEPLPPPANPAPVAVAAAPPSDVAPTPEPEMVQETAQEPEPVTGPEAVPDPVETEAEPETGADAELAVSPATPSPQPAPTLTETESFAPPASPVIGEVAGVAPAPAGAETATGQTVQTEAVAEPASQTAMAVPDTATGIAPATQPVPAAEALLQGQAFRDCANCPDMIVVVPPSGLAPEQVARVKRALGAPALTPFALGRFEVTFDDWARCMAGGGCAALPDDGGWGRNTRPVINVSHDEAAAQYIAWLASATGAAYRLPTSAEWDFAEAGGGVAPQGNVPLIDAQTVCQSGNYSAAASAGPQEAQCADGFPTTAPVGSLKANVLGLHDMRGNVWEWVSDCWTPGFTYKVKDSERDCRKRLLRGGSWSSRAMLSATPARGFEDARRASKSIGFRVARSLP